MEEDFAAKVMDVRVEKAKHDDDEDNAITANDANNAVATALRLMNMASVDLNHKTKVPAQISVWGCLTSTQLFTHWDVYLEERVVSDYRNTGLILPPYIAWHALSYLLPWSHWQ